MRNLLTLIAGAFVLVCQILPSTLFIDQALAAVKSVSGLPLPRFVSLKAKRVNMRVGPGRDYEVQWLYVRKGLPVEVFQEFGNWRKIRDPKGVEGWVLHSLLSGKRVVIVAPWDMANNDKPSAATSIAETNMYVSPATSAAIVARVEAGALADVERCSDDWCQLRVINEKKEPLSGYMQKSSLWGVYPGEVIKK